MKKVFSLIISLILVLTLFGACSKKEDKQNDSYTVYGFESALLGVSVSNDFGKVTINGNSDYVTEGAKSLKLTPSNADYPYLCLPFFSPFLKEFKNNLLKIHEILIDVYAEEETVIGVGLYFSDDASVKSTANKYLINKGWNTVGYKINLSVLEISCILKDFIGVYVAYEEVNMRSSVYIDNVRILESEEDIKYTSVMELDTSSDEVMIADFEKSFEQLLFSSRNTGTVPAPIIESVKAKDVGLAVSNGERVLRIKPTAKLENNTTYSETYIAFAQRYMGLIDWNYYSMRLNDYEFKFDVYIKTENPENAFIGLYFDLETNGWTVVGTSVSNEWTTCSVSLTVFEDYLKDCKNLYFRFVDDYDTTREFFIDNIRIERKVA